MSTFEIVELEEDKSDKDDEVYHELENPVEKPPILRNISEELEESDHDNLILDKLVEDLSFEYVIQSSPRTVPSQIKSEDFPPFDDEEDYHFPDSPYADDAEPCYCFMLNF